MSQIRDRDDRSGAPTRGEMNMYRGNTERSFKGPKAWGVATLALGFAFLAQPAAHAATLDLMNASINDVQAAYATGKLTSEMVTQAYLARIAAYDDQGPGINAVIMVNPNAIAEAKARDAERARPARCADRFTAFRSSLKTTTTPTTCPRPRARNF